VQRGRPILTMRAQVEALCKRRTSPSIGVCIDLKLCCHISGIVALDRPTAWTAARRGESGNAVRCDQRRGAGDTMVLTPPDHQGCNERVSRSSRENSLEVDNGGIHWLIQTDTGAPSCAES